jgi:hypothetical protein
VVRQADVTQITMQLGYQRARLDGSPAAANTITR